jgi:hypothetical protein
MGVLLGKDSQWTAIRGCDSFDEAQPRIAPSERLSSEKPSLLGKFRGAGRVSSYVFERALAES